MREEAGRAVTRSLMRGAYTHARSAASNFVQDFRFEECRERRARSRRAILLWCHPLLFFDHYVEHIARHGDRKRMVLPAARDLLDGMPSRLRDQWKVRRGLCLHLIDRAQ